MTTCSRFDKKLQKLSTFQQSAYLVDFQRLDYVLKLLNGDLTIKIELFAERDYFLINTIFNLIAKLRKKKDLNFQQRYIEKNKDQYDYQTNKSKVNFQIIMSDKFDTVNMAKHFEKLDDQYLGFIQFDFQIGKRATGNRILKTFLASSSKFTHIKINSYINFLDAETLDTTNTERFEKLSLSFYDNSQKLNNILSKFEMLKELEVRANRSPDILNLSHMQNLEKVNLKIEKNTSHVIINSGQNGQDSVPIL